MKKTLLSAAAFATVAVSAVAIAPTTSEAIPAFARQTGAACLSCHFQTFPALNSFGRAFKQGSFTDVGDQALVEDDNLSIPAVMNATIVIRGNIQKTTGSKAVYNIPLETPILVAGRVGTNSGFFVEFANGGTGGPVSVGNWQFLNSFDMGDLKVGLGAHNSAFGGSAVLETSNVFGQHSGKLGGVNLSAINTVGFTAPSLAIAGWVGNETFDVQAGLIAPSAAQGAPIGGSLGQIIRAHYFMDVAGFDTMIGAGIVAGNAKTYGTTVLTQNTTASVSAMDLKFVDFQMQGDLNDDMSLGIYGDFATTADKSVVAPVAGGVATTNFYGGAGKYTGFSLRAELKPVHNMGFGVGFSQSTATPTVVAPAVAVATKTNTFQVAAFYEVYQNFELNLIYNSAKAKTGILSKTTTTTTLEFEALL
ncbi:MAG: hypothetical protein Q9M11_08830 [Mariprofundaceae bacterium]|nr:hypothetical protein [Mariprofundaceae bacterium]